MAVMFAMLEPGDKIMGMNLDHGGHLTHGSPVNMSGKYFDVAHYGVNADGVIDYDEVLRIAKEHKPKLIVAGASNANLRKLLPGVINIRGHFGTGRGGILLLRLLPACHKS